ncbi:hypothetical protein B0H11DRAFT_2102392, partial [Mycena galericulata]
LANWRVPRTSTGPSTAKPLSQRAVQRVRKRRPSGTVRSASPSHPLLSSLPRVHPKVWVSLRLPGGLGLGCGRSSSYASHLARCKSLPWIDLGSKYISEELRPILVCRCKPHTHRRRESARGVACAAAGCPCGRACRARSSANPVEFGRRCVPSADAKSVVFLIGRASESVEKCIGR